MRGALLHLGGGRDHLSAMIPDPKTFLSNPALLDEALAGKDSVAEGVLNAQSAKALADRAGVEMPIIDATYRILFEGQAPREAVAELMARELRAERD